MSKKIKLAVIRSEGELLCPFGLQIPLACKMAGELIKQMAPLDILEDMSNEEKEEIARANNHLLMWKNPKERCAYAGKLFDNKDAVECNWNANDEGISQRGVLVGSPFYYKQFSGIGLDGLFSYPLGYYTDNSIDRGMYYGMYSLESSGSAANDDEENE